MNGSGHMGLDLVELVMEIEDEFHLAIPDAEAERLQTPGQVSAYVAARLRDQAGGSAGGACGTARTFYRLRRELGIRFGLPPRAVRPANRIGDLVPAAGWSSWPGVASA